MHGRVEVECQYGIGLVELDLRDGRNWAKPEVHAKGKWVGNGYRVSCVEEEHA